MRKLLIAVDASEHSDRAVEYVISLNKEHGPLEVHVVNVEPAPIAWQTQGMETAAIHAHLLTVCHTSIQASIKALKAGGIHAQAHCKLGDVAEEIVKTAEELECDTIIIGTRGLGAISGLALGSVTRKVLYLTQVPVICVK